MFPRIVQGSGVLPLFDLLSFSFLWRLHLAFSLLLRHVALSSNMFSITLSKCRAVLSDCRQSQSKPQEGEKKLVLSAEPTASHQMVADNTPFLSLHQAVSRLLSAAPVCFPNTDCPLEETASEDGLSLTFKQKSSIWHFWFRAFLRQRRKWKFPSVKLPPAIRPLISSVIFSCFFSVIWRKDLFQSQLSLILSHNLRSLTQEKI